MTMSSGSITSADTNRRTHGVMAATTVILSLKRGAERWAKRGGLKRECRVKTALPAAEPQQQPQPDERRRAEQQLRAVGADCSAVRAEGT